MHTTSPVLGSKDSRRIVTRTVVATDWTEV